MILGKLAPEFGVCAPFSGACSGEQSAHFIVFSLNKCVSHFESFLSTTGTCAVAVGESVSAFHLVHIGADVLVGRSY